MSLIQTMQQNLTAANTHTNNKRHLGGLYKDTPRKNKSRLDIWVDIPYKQYWYNNFTKLKPKSLIKSKQAKISRDNSTECKTDDAHVGEISNISKSIVEIKKKESGDEIIDLKSDLQSKGNYNCWQCIYGYDIGDDTMISVEMMKMSLIGQEEDAQHILVNASMSNGILHITNPPGLPTGPPTPELFAAQRAFVSGGIPGTIKLTSLLGLLDDSIMIGHKNETLVEKLANDVGFDVADIKSAQLTSAITNMVNKHYTSSITKHNSYVITLPTSTPTDTINDLNNEFGSGTFVRGNKEHHPHVYHHASRKAVTNLLSSWHGHNGLVYDIGGNPNDHMRNSRFHIHSVYSKSLPADYARHIKWNKDMTNWAKGVLENNTSSPSNINLVTMANGVLSKDKPAWCDDGILKCQHNSKFGSFAISIDTLTHITPKHLIEFYGRKKIFHAVHAITLPVEYMYNTAGTLKYNEGHWYRNKNEWTIEFVGESLPYTQSTQITDEYLQTPIFTAGEMTVYCKMSGYRGAHWIIEHFFMPRYNLDKLYAKHVMWFNTNMDEIFVYVPKLDQMQSKTLLNKHPYRLKQVVINLRFYERILTRLMQAYTWESTLSYAAGLIGRVYATSSGMHMKWNLTNSQVRDHCLVAYWTINQVNESLKPLIAEAGRTQANPDFLSSLWESIKNWGRKFAGQFDPSGADILQEFIASNKDNSLKLIQMFSESSRSIESLNIATQMVHSRSVVDWVSSNSGIVMKAMSMTIDDWRLSEQANIVKPTVYDLMTYGELITVGAPSICQLNNKCFHDHSQHHTHISANKSKVNACVCCEVLSSILPNGACNVCSNHPPCHGKNLMCHHEHTYINDECCGMNNCTCVKEKFCNCCGMPSIAEHCKVCQFDPRRPIPRDQGSNKPMPNKSSNANHNAKGPSHTDDFSNSYNQSTHNDKTSHPTNPTANTKKTVEIETEETADNDGYNKPPPPVNENDNTNTDATLDFDDIEQIQQNLQADPIVESNTILEPDLNKLNTQKILQTDVKELYDDPNHADVIDKLKRVRPIIDLEKNVGYGETNIDMLPTNYEGGVAVLVRGFTNVPGDGSCGAHAVSLATGVDLQSIKHWLISATQHDDWHNGVELAACCVAHNYNVIVTVNHTSTLYRANQGDVAISLVHGEYVKLNAHWVAGNVEVLSYSSIYNNQINENYTKLIRATNLTLDGSVETAYAYSASQLDIEQVISMGNDITINAHSVVQSHSGIKPKCYIDDTNLVKKIVGPTGSGKTTTGFKLVAGKSLIIMPLKAATISTYQYLKNKLNVVARAESTWYPKNITFAQVHSAKVVIMTMETLYHALFSGDDENKQYLKLIIDRTVICDEVHEFTPHYARLLTRLSPEKTIICSATLPSTKISYHCQYDIESGFMSDSNIMAMWEMMVSEQDFRNGECVIVPTKSMTHAPHSDLKIPSVTSDSASTLDLSSITRAVATNVVTTSVTLPKIHTIIDLGERIDPIINFTPNIERKNFIKYNKRKYSWYEMVQSRGRIARTSQGKFYGPVPRPEQHYTPQDALLISCYTGIPCHGELLPQWNSIAQSLYDEVQQTINDATDVDILSQWYETALSWLSIYGELLSCKLAGMQPTFNDDYLTVNKALSISDNIVGTYNPKRRVGSIKSSTIIMWSKLIPEDVRLQSTTIDYDNYKLLVNSSDAYLDIELDDNKQLADKLSITVVGEILSTINGLRVQASMSINTGFFNSTTGQFISYKNFDTAIKSSAKQLTPMDIVCTYDKQTSTTKIGHYQDLKQHKSFVIVPTFSTGHLLVTLRDLNYLRDSEKIIKQTLTNSVLFTGPPGSGKTTQMCEQWPNSIVTTTASGQLKSHDSWVPPSQINTDLSTVCIDEVGLMNVATLMIIASKCDKIVGTCDLAQIIHTAGYEAEAVIGESSAVDLLSKYANTITLEDTWRFGKKTCAMLSNLGYNIKSKVDIDEQITCQIGAVNDTKMYMKSLMDHSPDLIVCSSNNMCREFRKFTGIPVNNIDRCQGQEGKTVLLVLQNVHGAHLAHEKLYVALSRHKNYLHIIFDNTTAHIIKQLNLTTESSITYSNVLGGSSTMSWTVMDYISESSVDMAMQENKFRQQMIHIKAVIDQVEGDETIIEIPDKIRPKLGQKTDQTVPTVTQCYYNKSTDIVLIKLQFMGKEKVVQTDKLFPTEGLARRLIFSLGIQDQLKLFTKLLFKKFKKYGAKLSHSIVNWVNIVMNSKPEVVKHIIVADKGENIGGAIDIMGVIWGALTGMSNMIAILAYKLQSIGIHMRDYVDGAVVANRFKKYLVDIILSSASSQSDLGGSLCPELTALMNKITQITGKIFNNIVEFIKYVVDLCHRKPDTTLVDDVKNNELDDSIASNNSEIGDESSVEDDLQVIIDEIEVLFDFDEEFDPVHTDNESNDSHQNQAVEPITKADNNHSSNNASNANTHNDKPCSHNLLNKYMIGEAKTKLNINTYKPGFVGKYLMSFKENNINITINIPGIGKHHVSINKVCTECASVKVNSDGELMEVTLVKSSIGYKVYSVDNSLKIDPAKLGTILNYLSSIGGGDDGFMQLLKSLIGIMNNHAEKMSLLIKWKLKYFCGKVDMRMMRSELSVLDAYRKICHRLPTFYKNNINFKTKTKGGSHYATIELIGTKEKTELLSLFFLIYHSGYETKVIVYGSNKSLTDYLTKLILCGPEPNQPLGGKSDALSNLMRMGINVSDLMRQQSNITPDKLNDWLQHNPLTATFQTTAEPTYKSYKEILEEEQLLHYTTFRNINNYEQIKIALCIPSGHGKTTTTMRLQREKPELRVLDIDQVQEQATILHLPFRDKMLNYKVKVNKYIDSLNMKPHIVFCHSPLSAPTGYKPIVIINNGAHVPTDRIWSAENVAHLEQGKNTVHYVNSHEELFDLTVGYGKSELVGDMVLGNGSTLIDNISSVLGHAFMSDMPHHDDILRLPSQVQDTLSFSENNIGQGQQRIYQTGPHVEIMRPTINKVATSLPNAVTTRLMGRSKYRTIDLSINDYDKLLMQVCHRNAPRLIKLYGSDQINVNNVDILKWLNNKGSKLELITDMLKHVIGDEFATDPASIRVHYKVENLMKEQVNDILDQVGRVIVWNNQNINMFVCPVINEAKARFKTLLKPNVIYADGMSTLDLNDSLRKYRSKYLLEMDLSKQDRQTDEQILRYEWDLMLRLGVPNYLVDFMTSFMPKFRIRGTSGEKATLPAIHFSGGAMTSLGNEIRNLLLISDCLGTKFVAVYTMGDDSLALLNHAPNLTLYDRICRSRHNVINTALSSTHVALFLQMIICRNVDGQFYASHNFARLREKIAYSAYPNTSSDWKMKYASYLMMIGDTDITRKCMKYSGFVVFPALGTSMSERIYANALYNNCDESAVLNIINDVCHMRHEKSVEHRIEIPMLLAGPSLARGYKAVGEYVDNHQGMIDDIKSMLM